MFSDFLAYFNESSHLKYTNDTYSDFISQLGGKRFGNVLMFEIGTSDVLEIPCPFKEFLNEEIPLYSDACLAETFFNEWMEYSKETIEYGRCAGYKIPLFLGGEDTIANLENSDMETYWSVLSQIKNGKGAK